jgi:hypothetical protein
MNLFSIREGLFKSEPTVTHCGKGHSHGLGICMRYQLFVRLQGVFSMNKDNPWRGLMQDTLFRKSGTLARRKTKIYYVQDAD